MKRDIHPGSLAAPRHSRPPGLQHTDTFHLLPAFASSLPKVFRADLSPMGPCYVGTKKCSPTIQSHVQTHDFLAGGRSGDSALVTVVKSAKHGRPGPRR